MSIVVVVVVVVVNDGLVVVGFVLCRLIPVVIVRQRLWAWH